MSPGALNVRRPGVVSCSSPSAGPLRCGIGGHAEPAEQVRQVAWASSVDAAAIRSAGRGVDSEFVMDTVQIL